MKTIYLVTFLSLVALFGNASEKFSNKYSGFLENKGQVTDQFKNVRNDILYSYAGDGFNFFIKRDGIIYEFNQIEIDSTQGEVENYKVNYHRVEVDFIGANPNPEVVASGKSKDYLNFYLTYLPSFPVLNVHFFDTIRLKNILPNIDVQYVIADGNIKYDFIVAPGGKTENIKLHYKGLNGMTIGDDGGLLVETSLGKIIEEKPFSFVLNDEQGKEVLSTYLLNNDTLSFVIGNYDQGKTLIIDPTLEWATYYGGNISAEGAIGNDVVVDIFDDIIFCGTTNSTTGIATSGAFQSSFGGGQDGYFAKFAPDGSRIWATYFGGTDSDHLTCVTTDELGNIYVGGGSFSDGLGTSGTYQPNLSNGGGAHHSDNVISKFDKNGIRVWTTYYGGYPGNANLNEITYVNQEIVVVGNSSGTLNLSTPGSYQDTAISASIAFVAKFDSAGNISWGTYYGGLVASDVFDVITDSFGNIYFTGFTGGGVFNFYVQKFSSAGFPLWNFTNNYNTYGNAIAINRSDSKIYVATDNNILELDSAGNFVFDTTFGGILGNTVTDLFIDQTEDIFICAKTRNASNFTTSDAHQANLAGGGLNGFDGFFRQYNSALQIKYSTYYGGSDNEESFEGISGNDNGCIYLVGTTLSTTGISTPNSFRPVKGPSQEAFLVSFCGFISEPTNPSSNFNVSGSGCSIATINWSGGSGNKSLVIAKQGSPVNSFPVDGNSYNANAAFGSGQDLGNGNYSVYNGSGSSVTITNLIPGSTYYLAAFEYNGSGSSANYLTSNFATYSFTVPPALNISLVETNETCAGYSDGGIQLTAIGGTTPYNFSWSNGSTSEDLSNIGAASYSVTVSDANNCTATDTASITSNPLPSVYAGDNDTICQGENAVLTGSGSGNLLWSNGLTSSSITVSPSTSTDYFLTVTDSNGCAASDSTLVFVYQSAQAEISGLDSAFCESDSAVILTGTPTGGIFSGQGVNGNIFTPANASIGLNTITYSFSEDCITDAAIQVLVTDTPCEESPPTEFIIYDVYTPNGDGVNDFWVIDGIEAYPNNEITIYNRWGNVVYEAKNYANNWDGKSKKGEHLPSATYYYIIKLGDAANQVFSGPVTIIR